MPRAYLYSIQQDPVIKEFWTDLYQYATSLLCVLCQSLCTCINVLSQATGDKKFMHASFPLEIAFLMLLSVGAPCKGT